MKELWRRLRYRFWMYVHDRLEQLWHWVYYKKVKPLQLPFPEGSAVVYTKLIENDEVTIYRSN